MRTRTQTLTLTPAPTQPQPSPNLNQATLEVGLEVLGEPAKLVKPDSVPETLICGFLGEPDPGGFYARGSRNIRDMAAKGAAPSADSKGRIGGTGGS